MELFRKGQLVPKRLGVLHVHKKVRHRIKFNCDVYVEVGKTWHAVNGTGKSLFYMDSITRKHRNGTKQEYNASFVGLNADLHGVSHAFIVSEHVKNLRIEAV